MAPKHFLVIATGFCVLSGCASSSDELGLNGNRSVFHNPYSTPVEIGEQDTGTSGLRYPGRGHYAYDEDGNRVRISRAERRLLRQRFRDVQDQIEINERVAEFNAQNAGPPEPVPSAPPVAIQSARESDGGANLPVPSGGDGSLPQ